MRWGSQQLTERQKRVADGTCTRVWAWMTDKCRRRMNERDGYITIEITQIRGTKEEEEEGPKKGERLLGCERSWEFLFLGEGSFLPGMLGRLILCIFHPQNESSPHQSPTFGPILYTFIVMGPIQKPRPYTYNILFIIIIINILYTEWLYKL